MSVIKSGLKLRRSNSVITNVYHPLVDKDLNLNHEYLNKPLKVVPQDSDIFTMKSTPQKLGELTDAESGDGEVWIDLSASNSDDSSSFTTMSNNDSYASRNR